MGEVGRNLVTRIRWSGFTAWKAKGEHKVAFLPAEVLAARQAARFRALARFAWEVPFYRDWFREAGAEPGDLRSAEDLARLPLVDKLALTMEPERFTAPGSEARDGLTLLSSGTSGRRRSFRFTAGALFEALAAGRRQRLAMAPFIGQEAGYREAVLNRDGSSGDQIRRFWESRMISPRGLELRRRKFLLLSPFPEILAGLNEFRPDVLRGIGSHVGAFLRWVYETGRFLNKPKAVTYGADAMPATDRRIIEEELGIPVVSTYQAIEALRIGFQCEVRRGFHLSIDQVAARVVDASGRDVAPGERGALVLTNLTNRATVVMNYRLGDLVTLGRGPCPCGRTLPLIEDIDGRLDDLLVRPGGSSVHALAVLPQLQAVAGVRQVQIIQEELDDFRLRVVWARGSAEQNGELRTRMAAALGTDVRVQVDAVEALPQEPSGKVKTVVCQVAHR